MLFPESKATMKHSAERAMSIWLELSRGKEHMLRLKSKSIRAARVMNLYHMVVETLNQTDIEMFLHGWMAGWMAGSSVPLTRKHMCRGSS